MAHRLDRSRNVIIIIPEVYYRTLTGRSQPWKEENIVRNHVKDVGQYSRNKWDEGGWTASLPEVLAPEPWFDDNQERKRIVRSMVGGVFNKEYTDIGDETLNGTLRKEELELWTKI